MDDTEVIAAAVSPQGRTVQITAGRWEYVEHHIEMRGKLELLLITIRQPDIQEPDPRPGRERYWRRMKQPFQFRWMRAVVQFEGDVDSVVTAFGQNNDPEGFAR